jgi:hypothetical protein
MSDSAKSTADCTFVCGVGATSLVTATISKHSLANRVYWMSLDMVWAEIALAAVAFYGAIAPAERAATFWHLYRTDHCAGKPSRRLSI